MRITINSLGAWVIKCNPSVTDWAAMVEAGEPVRTWCVADNYRTGLMDAGQPVVLWLSGPARGRFPRGIWGIGRMLAPAKRTPAPEVSDVEIDRKRRVRHVAQVDIPLWTAPIPATELLGNAALQQLEVIRQPYAANPSWMAKEEFTAIRRLAAERSTPLVSDSTPPGTSASASKRPCA